MLKNTFRLQNFLIVGCGLAWWLWQKYVSGDERRQAKVPHRTLMNVIYLVMLCAGVGVTGAQSKAFVIGLHRRGYPRLLRPAFCACLRGLDRHGLATPELACAVFVMCFPRARVYNNRYQASRRRSGAFCATFSSKRLLISSIIPNFADRSFTL